MLFAYHLFMISHWSQPVLLSLGSQFRAWAVCSCLSIGFVSSLYLVPARIRALRRYDPVQVNA
jgi:hypothetical protein